MIKFEQLLASSNNGEVGADADPEISLNHSIGSSDGRCVQRAGRNQRELMTRAY